MKKLSLLFIVIFLPSCSSMGLKRVDGQPQPAPVKQGVTWGGPAVGKVEVQKGYWCEVRGGILTFGDSGPTEAIATENARKKCRDVVKNSSCELQSCKPN